MTAKYQRQLQSGKEFDKFFPAANVQDDILHRDGDLKLTIREMVDIINKYSWQTEKLAAFIAEASGYNKDKDLRKLMLFIWTFFYNHYQYKNDAPGQEQLRTPARAWHDRKTGIDCDCYTLSIGCILTNLNIPFSMRITKYLSDWQHVYIVVKDKARNRKYVVDCVLDGFNLEKPYGPDGDFDPTAKLDINIKPSQMNGLAGIPIALLSGPDDDDTNEQLGEIGKWFPGKRFLKKAALHRIARLKKLAQSGKISEQQKRTIEAQIRRAEARLSGIAGIDDDDLDGIDDAEDILDGVEETLELEGAFDDEDGLGNLGAKKKAKRKAKRKAKKARRVAKRRARKLKRVPKIIVAKKAAAIAKGASPAALPQTPAAQANYAVQPGFDEYAQQSSAPAPVQAASVPAAAAAAKYTAPIQQVEEQMEMLDEQVNNAPEEEREEIAEEGYEAANEQMDTISQEMAEESPEAEEAVEEANEESALEENPDEVMNGILAGTDFEPVWEKTDGILGSADDDEIELASLPVETQQEWLGAIEKHVRKTRNYIAKYPGTVVSHGGAQRHIDMCDFYLKNCRNPYKREKALEHLAAEELRMSKMGVFGDADDTDILLSGGYDDSETIDGLDGKKKKKGKFWQKLKKAGKKVFKFVQKTNPLMIAARNGFLLAAKLNFFGLARKLYPGFMSWEEAQKAGLKRDFWERKQKAAKKFADKWENVLGGKKDKLVKALQKGWKKKKHFKPGVKKSKALKGLLGWVELDGLGEPTSAIIGTSVAAAATIIAKLASILKKNGANDLPPEDVADGESYEEDKVESTANAVADVANAATDVANSFSGLLGVNEYINTALDCAVDPVLGDPELDETAIDQLGDKAARQAKRAQRKANRKQKKAGKKQKRQSAKTQRQQKKTAKKAAKEQGKQTDADEDSESPTVVEKIQQGVQAAGGMVSAANQLYKNKTGKNLIPGEVEEFASAPDKFFSPEEMKAIEANDKKVKENFTSEAGFSAGKIAAAAAITGAVGIGLKMAFEKKPERTERPPSGLRGVAKAKNKQKTKVKEVKFN